MMKVKPAETAGAAAVQATSGVNIPDALPIPGPSSDRRAETETLMPYEKAAKAIYVRANGLPAYYRATGHIHRCTDIRDCEPT